MLAAYPECAPYLRENRLIIAVRCGLMTPWKILPRVVGEMKKGGDGFDADDEYQQFRRRQRIHRYHLIGYAVSSALILIAMLILWR